MDIKKIERYLFKMIPEIIREEYTWRRVGIIMDHLKDIPNQKLYKFRECNPDNFDALEKQSLWLSKACNFDDIMDTIIPFNVSSLSDETLMQLFKLFNAAEYANAYKKYDGKDTTVISPDIIRQLIQTCYDENFELIPKKADKFLRKNKQLKTKENLLQLHQINQSFSRRGVGKECIEWYKKDAEIGCEESLSKIRDITYVCSLTESNDNPAMWENYAGKYSGYCIEFDFSNGLRVDYLKNSAIFQALLLLLPVIYTEERPPFNTAQFLRMQYEDEFEKNKNSIDQWDEVFQSCSFYEQMLIKHPCYSYEKEWRIIFSDYTSQLLKFPFMSAIYLGKDIGDNEKNKLIEIAKKINISVYQQVAGTYKYEYQQIHERTNPICTETKTYFGFLGRKFDL